MPPRSQALLLILPLLILLAACAGQPASPSPLPDSGGEIMTLELTSPAFQHEGTIPNEYTCDGDNVSPALDWSGPPAATASFALIMDDPDAPSGTFVHWVLFNLPVDARSIPLALPPDATLSGGGVHGNNSRGRLGYTGPCPPGGTHRYFFKLYALDAILDLQPGATKQDVVDAMQGHVLAEGQLMGTYTR